ncbi:MAG: hypothetical protein IJ298_00040 [Ruminococcus sp.]|nr:hypothetical protein [Ruminococcus sp.]
MDKDKQKCPYCSRKISYKTRLLEHGDAEHDCPHCNKTSKITQNSNIWILLILCSMVAIFIMIFYFTSAKSIQNAFDDDGKFGFLVALFFGKGKEIKWMLWEMIPFAVFFFVSPLFIEFSPLKRFMEQTPSNIDLSVPVSSSSRGDKPTGRTRSIPKTQTTSFKGVYEDISSSSETVDKTRAFRMSDMVHSGEIDGVTDVTPVSTSKSGSYSSDAPLKRVNHEQVREYTPRSERVHTQPSAQKSQIPRDKKPTQGGNYSANRKF